MHGHWDEARDDAAHEPGSRGLERVAEYTLGAVSLMVVVAGILAAWILDRAESLLGGVKRRLALPGRSAG